MSAEESSPRPWRVADIDHDHDILDADGRVAARAAHGNRELAALIVDAVNNADSWRSACIKARTERNAFLLDRDRLRDLVRRLADALGEANDSCHFDDGPDVDLVREARAALGEGGRT